MDNEIEIVDGLYYVTSNDEGPGMAAKRWKNYKESTDFMSTAIKLIPFADRKVVVQAGGCIGTHPMFLSPRFDKVYTFEPDPVNFRCMVHNLAGYDNVEMYRGALGDKAGFFEMHHVPKGIGSHYMTDREGKTKVHRIDDLKLTRLDYLMLDVEGFEYPALQGGLETIKKCRPIIQVEDKGNGKSKGRGHTIEDILKLLPEYKIFERVHYDQVLVPGEFKR